MTNYRTPRTTIPITPEDKVTSKSDQPMVTRATWSADDGAARFADIERARQMALEQQQKAIEEAHPINQRVGLLEARVERQEAQIKTLMELIGKTKDA